MRTKLKLIVPMILILVLLTGCGIEIVSMPELPKFAASTSTLTGTVEYVNGRTCRVAITEGDSHFDAEDVIQLTYTNIEGSKKSINIGDIVKFEYSYSSQVSEHLGSPHIMVNTVNVD